MGLTDINIRPVKLALLFSNLQIWLSQHNSCRCVFRLITIYILVKKRGERFRIIAVWNKYIFEMVSRDSAYLTILDIYLSQIWLYFTKHVALQLLSYTPWWLVILCIYLFINRRHAHKRQLIQTYVWVTSHQEQHLIIVTELDFKAKWNSEIRGITNAFFWDNG